MSTALTTSERDRFDDLPFVHEGYLYIYDAPVVFEATISSANDAETHVAIATDTITTGSFSDIKVGMTLELEDDDGNFRGRQRVRGTDDPNILTGRAPRSNFDGGLNPGEATTVKVYDEYRVWAKIPYIDPAGNQLRDQQTYPGADEAQPPLANNAFPAALLISEDGGARLLEFDASLSRGIRSGSNPISYSWDFGDGTITSGTSTDVDPTVSFPVGDRYVDLTVTDDNDVAETTRILVCVVERSALIPARITRRSRGINRNDFVIESPADLLSTDTRDGAPILYADNDSIGNFSSRFYGWLGEVSSRYPDPANGIGFVSITCEDVGTRLRKLVSFPQVVKVAEDATGSWQFLPDVDIRVLIHHMWRWYSSALEVATLDIGTVVYSLPRLEVTGNTLFDQFDRLAQAIGHRVSIDMTGVIRIIADPVVQPTADQKTEYSLPFERDVTVRTSLTETDYAEPGFSYTHVPRISWARAKGIVAATSAADLRVVSCIAPSKTPGQGTTESSDTEQLVNATTPQDELNVRTGNRYASRQDNPFGQLQIELAKSRGIFDPALMQVFKVELPDTLKNRHGISDDDLWLLNNVDETFEPADGIKLASAAFERITAGRPGETVAQDPPPSTVDEVDEAAIDAIATSEITNPFDETPGFNLDGLPDKIAAILNDGSIALTSNATSSSPNWTVYDHSATLGTDVRGWCLRAGQSTTDGWVTCGNGVFLIQDISASSPTITDQTPSVNPDEIGYWGIDADYVFAPGEVVVVGGTSAYTNTGDRYLYINTSGGSGAWTAFTDSSFSDCSRCNSPRNIVVSPGDYGRVVFSHRSDPNESGVYFTTDLFSSTLTQVVRDFPIGSNIEAGLICTGGQDRPEILFYGAGDELRRYNTETGTTDNLALPGNLDKNDSGRFQLVTNPGNTNDLAYPSRGSGTGPIYVTHNALSSSLTWYAITPPIGIERCALIGANATGVFGFGRDGICYSGDTYTDNTATDITGDLDMTDRKVIGIAGY